MSSRQAFYLFSIVAFLLAACHSSRPLSYGDNKVYNDDSAIEMKSIERKSKMPFDTSAPMPKARRSEKLK